MARVRRLKRRLVAPMLDYEFRSFGRNGIESHQRVARRTHRYGFAGNAVVCRSATMPRSPSACRWGICKGVMKSRRMSSTTITRLMYR